MIVFRLTSRDLYPPNFIIYLFFPQPHGLLNSRIFSYPQSGSFSSFCFLKIPDICNQGWSYFGGYCYFTSAACASWLTAESNCSNMSSGLVTVHNQEENVYIQHRHNGHRSWIGLNDRNVEGSFVWTNKEISSFRFWSARQPNNWKNEDCVHTLGASHGYTWNDVSCDNCYSFTCFAGTMRPVEPV